MWDAKVGDQVVCIRDFPSSVHGVNETVPVMGQILTIRHIEPSLKPDENNACFFRFVEIVNPVQAYRDGTEEMCFGSGAFRPILKGDISAFTAILAKPNKKIKAPEGPLRVKKRIKEDV